VVTGVAKLLTVENNVGKFGFKLIIKLAVAKKGVINIAGNKG